jgi:hypothetical protein
MTGGGARLRDGVLVAADTDLLANAGIRYPLAYTTAVYADCIAWPEDNPTQDVTGREWDVIWMLRNAMTGAAGDRVAFTIYRVPPGSRTGTATLVHLIAHVGPGDQAEPVLTVMQPHED